MFDSTQQRAAMIEHLEAALRRAISGKILAALGELHSGDHEIVRRVDISADLARGKMVRATIHKMPAAIRTALHFGRGELVRGCLDCLVGLQAELVGTNINIRAD